MKKWPIKRILFAFALTFSLPASAVWVWVADTDDATHYIDPTTLQKTGPSRIVWELTDYKEPTQYGIFSTVARWEYDCVVERKRVLTSAFYTGKMGTGSVITSNEKTSEWNHHPPNSLGYALLKLICGL
jgi:hypothetical protein